MPKRLPPQENRSRSPEEYYYPNKMGRIVLASLTDIMGHRGISAVLSLAQLNHYINNLPPDNLEPGFRFNEFGALQQTLETMYGSLGGRGLALRAGRQSFKYALKEFMPVLGIADLAFRPLPLGVKLRIGLDVFAETFNKLSDQVVRLGQDNGEYQWIIERCPVCWDRQTDSPCCHLAVGLLQQSLYWVSNGRRFLVHEAQCVAAGADACVITIGKQPVR